MNVQTVDATPSTITAITPTRTSRLARSHSHTTPRPANTARPICSGRLPRIRRSLQLNCATAPRDVKNVVTINDAPPMNSNKSATRLSVVHSPLPGSRFLQNTIQPTTPKTNSPPTSITQCKGASSRRVSQLSRKKLAKKAPSVQVDPLLETYSTMPLVSAATVVSKSRR